jgi:non-specific serine/threonine protein kinase
MLQSQTQIGGEMDNPNEQLALDPLTERELDILRLIAEGLSNREIAQALIISLSTVKWYNKQIYGKLGVGSRTQAVAQAREQGLLGAQLDAPISAEAPPRHNLPAQVTSFVGREHEIDEVRRLLETARLLTLTGPGGTGKTRLGLQVATEIVENYADGVYFIELASINDPVLVANAIAQVLDVKEKTDETLADSLQHTLSNKHMLLVLDNFEHVLLGTPLVSELLAAAPSLKVLVTSREALRLYGEQEYAVLPLRLPDLQLNEPIDSLTQYEAVTLFVQRAQAIQSDFSLTKDNTPAIAEICVQLDGLPLALELAAAHVRLFTPQVLLEQLENRLGALTGGSRDLPARQRTLRATVDWSYDLLTESEKTMFARLAVFSGGGTLQAIKQVSGQGMPGDGLETLASLASKSLVLKREGLDGEFRFWMLETVREYAKEKLEANGEAKALRQQHAAYYLTLAEQAAPALRQQSQIRWLNRLKLDENNMRAALKWSLSDQSDARIGLRLAGALGEFWSLSNNFTESSEWLALFLARRIEASPLDRAKALNAAGILAYRKGNYEHVQAQCGEALDLFREAGDKSGSALALHFLAHVAEHQSDYGRATELLEESMSLYDALDDKSGRALSLNCLGDLQRGQGNYDRAAGLLEQALILGRERNDTRMIANAATGLGHAELRLGNNAQAQAYLEEALALGQDLGTDSVIGISMIGLAGVSAAMGQPEWAARLLGAVDALFAASGFSVPPADRADFDHHVTATRAALDEATFEAAWAEGRAMTVQQAIAMDRPFN